MVSRTVPSLDAKQMQVLELAAKGCNTKETASELGWLERQVLNTKNEIMLALEASNWTNAVAIAMYYELVK